MTNHINVTIESSTRFRSNSAGSEQKEFNQNPAYWALLAQILKAMVIMASLVGAGVALAWFFGVFEASSSAQNSLSGEMGKGVLPRQSDGGASVLSSVAHSPRIEEARRANQQEVAGLSSSISQSSPMIVATIPIGRMAGISTGITLNKKGTLAFIVIWDAGLVIVDVGNTSNPVEIGVAKIEEGNGLVINKNETQAYVASWTQGLVIVDITNTSNPVEIGRFGTGKAHGITLDPKNGLAYLANYDTGLAIVNVTNSSNPAQIGRVNIDFVFGAALNREGSLVFVASYSKGLTIVDVSNPFSPITLGGWETGNGRGVTLNKEETLAFVANSNTGLVILNVSNPSSPVMIGGIRTGLAYAVTLNKGETLAFVSNYGTGLVIVNMRDTSNLMQVGERAGLAYGVALNSDETLAYVANADKGLVISRLQNVLSFPMTLEVKNVMGVARVYSITLNKEQTLTFLADVSVGLVIVNVKDVSNPVEIGRIGTGAAYSIALNKEETRAYVGNFNTGLVAVDVSNPSNPVSIGSNGMIATRGVTLNKAGVLAYVANGDLGLVIIDVSTSALSQVGKCETGTAYGIALNPEETHAYVANYDSGLVIVDISNTSNPVKIGAMRTGMAYGITLNKAGTLAFVANVDSSLVIIDVIDPSTPKQISSTRTGAAYGVTLNSEETLAFVSNGNTGLIVVNVSDPLNPIQMAAGRTGAAYGIALNNEGTLAYVANYDTGLAIVDIYSPYISIPVNFPIDTASPKLILKVASPNNGKLFFFTQNGTSFNPVILSVSQIDISGNENYLPYWFSFSTTDYQFSGIPTKDWSDQELVIRAKISQNGVIRAAQCSVFIEPSLVIDIDSPKLSIQSPGTLGSLSVLLSNPKSGRFVSQPFGGVSFTFNSSSGTGNGVGTIQGFNEMFQVLQFSVDNPAIFNAATVSLTVDDTVNVPQTATASLDKFILHPPPIFNPGVLVNQTINAKDAFQFTIPENTFSANPASLSLSYSATGIHGTTLPSWLTYNPITREFSGIPPLSMLGQSLDIEITVDDGYKTSTTTWQLHIRDYAAPAFNPNSGFTNTTIQANHPFIYVIPENTFIDSLPLSYSATLKGTRTLPVWLNFNAVSGVFTGTPPIDMLGHSFDLVITADNGYRSSSINWTLYVQNHAAPRFNPNSTFQQTLPIDANHEFTYAIPSDTFLDSLPLTYSAQLADGSALPIWLKFIPGLNVLSGTPPLTELGQTLNITLTASNEYWSANTTMRLAIRNHHAPVVNPNNQLQNLTVNPRHAFTYAIPANTFIDTLSLTYSAMQTNGQALPIWLSFNSGLGAFGGTPPFSAMGDAFIINITADNGYRSNSLIWDLLVKYYGAPTFNPTSGFKNQTIQALQTFAYALPGSTFVDTLPVTVSARQADGEGLPVWLNFNANTDVFSGTAPIAYLGKNIDVALTASNEYKSTSIPWQLSVQMQYPPVFNPGSGFENQTVFALHPFNYGIPDNTFTDKNGLSLAYSLSGSALQSWLSFNPRFNSLKGTVPGVSETEYLVLSADNGYFSSNVSWVITIEPNQAPRIGIALRDASAIVNQEFVYPISRHAFLSNDTLSYAASLFETEPNQPKPLPTWLRLDQIQGVLTGKPSEYDLGSYRILINANTEYAGQANQTFTIGVSRSGFDEFLYLLKFIGPAVSALGVAWTLYKNKALIRNTWTGRGYTRPANLFDENGLYHAAIPADEIKEVKILERKSPQTCAKKTAVVLTHCLSHHLYGQVTFVQRQYEDWVKYDRRTNTLQLDMDKVPESGEWGIQILNNDDYVLEEVVLSFPWNQEVDIVESEELQPSRRSLGDRVSPREGVEETLLQHES